MQCCVLLKERGSGAVSRSPRRGGVERNEKMKTRRPFHYENRKEKGGGSSVIQLRNINIIFSIETKDFLICLKSYHQAQTPFHLSDASSTVSTKQF